MAAAEGEWVAMHQQVAREAKLALHALNIHCLDRRMMHLPTYTLLTPAQGISCSAPAARLHPCCCAHLVCSKPAQSGEEANEDWRLRGQGVEGKADTLSVEVPQGCKHTSGCSQAGHASALLAPSAAAAQLVQ